MPDLPGLWQLTPWGAFLGSSVLILVSIIRGWLIPKSTHEREITQERQRGDEWKETAMDQRTVNQEIREQNGQLIKANSIVESLIRAASPPFDERSNKGGST